jgi:hypothetical protein
MNKTFQIAVIGSGYVGSVAAVCFTVRFLVLACFEIHLPWRSCSLAWHWRTRPDSSHTSIGATEHHCGHLSLARTVSPV